MTASPPDPPDVTIAAQRTVIAVLREALDAERARSDARIVALARIIEIIDRDESNAPEACQIARAALGAR